jgi:hypothetical protein
VDAALAGVLTARYAETRVYESADMLYFVYFDAAGVMRDFTCVSR